MANHVIRDRVWDSRKLRRCSRDAALAYPTIFLVADDWGRFEFDPQRIWSKAFGGRRDITEAEVEAWLAEYEREELLIRYGREGDLAAWTGFKGRPPSKRRPSDYPDPKDVRHKRVKVPSRKAAGTATVPSGYPLADQESRDRSGERSGEEPAPAAAVAVEPPPTPATPAEATVRALAVVGPPWNSRACEVVQRRYGGTAPGARITKALRPLVSKHGEDPVLAAFARYVDETEAEYLSPERFATTYGHWAGTASRPLPRAKPTVGSATSDVIREIARREGKG